MDDKIFSATSAEVLSVLSGKSFSFYPDESEVAEEGDFETGVIPTRDRREQGGIPTPS